jgi:hypothetical protein
MKPINGDTKNQICFAFSEGLDGLRKLVVEYELFFQNLVYHSRYCEHTTKPTELGSADSIKTTEIITNCPILPHITEADLTILNSLKETLDRMLSLFTIKNNS